MMAESEGVSTEPFGDLIGQPFVDYIFEQAPRKVASRVGKALDHYTKALKLRGVDDEMGAIRCIAAEEELVVAIFEWFKLNVVAVPEHRDFIRRFKNHGVKLAFAPVLSQFRFVLSGMFEHGMTFDGFENVLRMTVAPALHEGRVMLRISRENGDTMIHTNPLHVSIGRSDMDHDDVAESLFHELVSNITAQRQMTLKEFITARAEYRNKLLYANDAGFGSMEETLDELINTVFVHALRDLLWTLAVLLANRPVAKDWGLVSQFLSVYRRALGEAKLI